MTAVKTFPAVDYLTTVDLQTALLLAAASSQAYSIFNPQHPAACALTPATPPAGYDWVDSWTGVDAIFNQDQTVECYGLVLRSQTAPYEYIFAFRGTDSIEDLIDDFGCNQAPFVPAANAASLPPAIKVESGFWKIYTDTLPTVPSMQSQLLALVDKYQHSDYPIDRLWVTGHSLGAALCQIFTLDLLLSRPTIRVANYNFASPRVGNAPFAQFYADQFARRHPSDVSIRFQNIHDRVPCVPLIQQGYRHVFPAYLMAFSRSSLIDFDFLVDNHAIANYQAVLQCATQSAKGVCLNDHLDVAATQMTLRSTMPDPARVCQL
jgi:triacylglycerol lipase